MKKLMLRMRSYLSIMFVVLSVSVLSLLSNDVITQKDNHTINVNDILWLIETD